MTRLSWDMPGDRLFTLGVDRGVLYPLSSLAVPWNGLKAVKTTPSGGASNPLYYDGQRYFNEKAIDDSFAGSIEAITYPVELDTLDTFGFSYRTTDENGSHKIHLVYNVRLTPMQIDFQSINDSAELSSLSWNFTTKPIAIPGYRASAHLVVDESIAYSWAVTDFENMLYGYSAGLAHLPSPIEVIQLFENASIVKITDNGNGTWTADGPDSAVYMLDVDTFEINWPSAVFVDANTYTIRSL